MGAPKLIITKDTRDLRERVAKAVVESAHAAIQARGKFTLALSGGSMPQSLSGLAEVADVPWDKVFVFFSDERCVALDHPDSNYLACKIHFLDKVGIPRDNIITIDPFKSPGEAADLYQTHLVQIADGSHPTGQAIPQLDVVLLGMGPDGHTASLFPGHALVQENNRYVAPILDSPKPPRHRITLTMPVLNNARKVIFIAIGESKASLLEEAFLVNQAPSGSKQFSIRSALPYPAFQVSPHDGPLIWFTDEAGASRLSPEIRALS